MGTETEALEQFFAAINRNDMRAVTKDFDPEIVRIEPEGFPTAGTYRGIIEVQEHIRKGRGTWAEGTCAPESFLVNGDKVVVYLHALVRLKGSTEWLDERFADGFAFRSGKIIEYITFAERAEAVKWAGLEDHIMTKRVDRASRMIAAPPAAIYRALLDREARRSWLPPKGMTGIIERFQAKVGGGYRMVLSYKDAGAAAGKASADSDVVEARFVDLVPNTRVVEAIDFESDDAAFAGTMTMTWALTPVEGGTEVRITAEDVPSGISVEDHHAGMSSSLQNLAEFVE